MKRVIWGGIIFALTVAAGLLALNFRVPPPRAISLLPQSTLLFLDVPSAEHFRASFSQTELYALLHDPEFAPILEQPRRMFLQMLGGPMRSPRGQQYLNLLQELFRGETFLAITHFTAFPSLDAGVVFGVDVKRKDLEVRSALTYFERRLRRRNPEAVLESKSFLGVSYSLTQLRPNVTICNAALGSMLVFTLGEETMRDVITRFTRKVPAESPSLAASEDYRAVMKRLSKNAEFTAYVNVQQITRLLGPLLAFASPSSGVLGKIARIKAKGASMSFVDGHGFDVSYAAFSRPVTNSVSISRKTLMFAPEDTKLYGAQSLDLASLYRQLMELAAQFGSNFSSAAARIQDGLARSGGRVEKVLAQLGPETAVISNWREGARLPEVAIITAFSGGSASRVELDSLADALKEAFAGGDENYAWIDTDEEGRPLRTLKTGDDQITPTYAVVNDFLIVASTRDYVRELLMQTKAVQPNLERNKTYDDVMRRLPRNGVEYFYCDVRNLFLAIYTAVPHDENWPAAATISRHLSAYASTRVVGERGETTTTISPTGKATLLAGAVFAGLAAAQNYFATLNAGFNPAAPKTFSDRDAGPPQHESRTAKSQIPSNE